MSSKLNAEKISEVAVLRFLNGPFHGCEYSLAEGRTLFVVGAMQDLIVCEVMPEFSNNTVVVPMPKGGINFEIILSSKVSDGFLFRILDDTSEDQQQLFQDACSAGTVRFSVRPPGVEWVNSIQKNKLLVEVAVDKKSLLSTISWVGGLAVLFFIMTLIIVTRKSFKEDEYVTEVTSAISGSISEYKILKGRDSIVYVFANSDRDLAWGRQALIRRGLSDKVKISSLRLEESRINKLLQSTYPNLAFHRLNLDEVAKPVLMLSAERTTLTSEIRTILIERMMHWMPYSDMIILDKWDDAMIEKQARTGLDRIGITYLSKHDDRRITFLTKGDLTDVELLNLQRFTHNFYQYFGVEYVHFSVDLEDDWLKNKSFKYNGNDYVKMTSKHWLFTKSL
ncbi:PrgH/EprH family type III secretion apparatus protein [Glaciimonas sp. Gout2]|uniref:PrgH/EprH family type III secretion apparatus protein n=1 Tax=unclassified Glaciimonas TaxID=2644401 RepID=UPI002B2326B3|nr:MULTISPECIES: PrgH/EprH family type III secretion apparatus protein [unclassified Glaciimonas]MEB0010305.1 PrgH/EprH family type III secretion apparatus protein [Glaciimonas sp. Cout2]MEB0084770.1 PrgH/EprH family type III secretion apparatus protein [Glaciimonas sp. Gout2]